MSVPTRALPGGPYPGAALAAAGASLSVTTLRWWSGTFCAFLGAFMMVAPNHFDGPAYAALLPPVAAWGAAFLTGGWAMLTAAATRPRSWLHIAAHVVVACVFALLAGGFASVQGWSGTIVYGVLSLGIVASSLAPAEVSAGEPPRVERRQGDLYAFLVGVSQVLLGSWLLAAELDPVIYPVGDAPFDLLGGTLLLTGGLLAAVQLRPGTRRLHTKLVHVAAGSSLLVAVWFLALPARSWTGMVFYGSGALLVAFQPWLRFRLRGFDAASLAARLSLVLGAATSIPLVLALAVVEADHQPVTPEHSLRAFLLVIVSVSLAVLIGTGAARFLGRPLRRLAEAADRLAGGEPAVPLEVTGISEVDRLSYNFRSMRDRLAERSRVAEDLAAELRRRAEDLSEADRRKDEFLAMLAHELRNPLGAIANASHLLESVAGGDPRVDRATGVIHRQMQHLVRLVDDLLDVSRITRGKVALKRTRLDLVEVVRRSVEAAAPRLEEVGLRLDLDLPQETIVLEADATRLEQVLGNLLSNAIKYTEPGGEVRLRLESAPQRGEAVLQLADDGIGMPPELVPRIFDLFIQGERALDRRAGGLGIGLTLVHQLVALHGGRVSAHSEGVGRGSQFVVRLPLAALPDSESAQAR